MANKNPSCKWQKGVSGNPNGSKGFLPQEIRIEIAKDKNEAKQLIVSYLKITEEQFLERQAGPNISTFEKMLGSIIQKVIEQGDINSLRGLWEIAFGKLKDEPTEFEKLNSEEQLMILKYRKLKANEETIIENS